MELDDRKLKILQTIIRTYLETGEPVGSRTISKDTDLNLSSATIRNEMSDLEEMGYIIQPHTSAGRIPSDKGYRLYVDTMLDDKTSEVMNLKDELEQKAGKIDVLLKQVAKLQTIQIMRHLFRDRDMSRRKLSLSSLHRLMQTAFWQS